MSNFLNGNLNTTKIIKQAIFEKAKQIYWGFSPELKNTSSFLKTWQNLFYKKIPLRKFQSNWGIENVVCLISSWWHFQIFSFFIIVLNVRSKLDGNIFWDKNDGMTKNFRSIKNMSLNDKQNVTKQKAHHLHLKKLFCGFFISNY